MPVSAILVVDNQSLFNPARTDRAPVDPRVHPVASVKVLGQSVLERTIGRLQASGIRTISVISESVLSHPFILDDLSRQASRGFASIFLIKLGAYAEVNYVELLKFHHEAGTGAVRVCDSGGPLDFWVLDLVRLVRSGIDFESFLRVDDEPHLLYMTKDYVNRMTDAAAVRRLAVDMLLGRCAARPCGEEVTAGVWIDRGARVHRSARIVAPAYIGRAARIGASAMVAGCSAVEQCARLDRGAVVDESSILPHTYVGKGINVAHAVVAESQFMHLRSDVEITIDDPRILDRADSKWRSFWYDRKAECVPQPVRPTDPVPSAYASGHQPSALRVSFKGEV